MQDQRITAAHPDGAILEYADALNRPQTSVDGPKGHILVTRNNRFEPFKVWHSDSIGTIITTSDWRRAVRTACVAAGLDPKSVVFEVAS